MRRRMGRDACSGFDRPESPKHRLRMANRPFGKHYALTVLGIVFVALLAAAGLRATPAVLMVPWGQAFGWSRATISFAAATGIFLFGMTGPFAAALMQRFGIRAVVLAALALM